MIEISRPIENRSFYPELGETIAEKFPDGSRLNNRILPFFSELLEISLGECLPRKIVDRLNGYSLETTMNRNTRAFRCSRNLCPDPCMATRTLLNFVIHLLHTVLILD